MSLGGEKTTTAAGRWHFVNDILVSFFVVIIIRIIEAMRSVDYIFYSFFFEGGSHLTVVIICNVLKVDVVIARLSGLTVE